MNNKGFTLVELLAVIIILSILVVLAGTSVGSVVKDSKNDLYQAQISSIKEAARAWYVDNTNYFFDYYDCGYITLKDLKEYGLIDSEINNPKTEKNFSNNIKIKISLNNSKYYETSKINYEVNPDDVDNCPYFYRTICTLSNDSIKKGFEVGAKYECEVKTGTMYNFYVLSSNEDESINLIMDRNINSDGTPTTKKISMIEAPDNGGIYNIVPWVSQEDYNDDSNFSEHGNNNKGPITAMNFLHEATKDWANIQNIVINYSETGDYGYGRIVTEDNITKIIHKDGVTVTANYTNLKARMPYKSEIASSNGSNDFLYEYLNESYWYGSGTQPVNNINNILGYWSLSSDSVYSDVAWRVYSDGTVMNNYVLNKYSHGVRPVITLPQTELTTIE